MNWLKRLFKTEPKGCRHVFGMSMVFGKAYHVPGPFPITINGHRIDGHTKIPHTYRVACGICGETK